MSSSSNSNSRSGPKQRSTRDPQQRSTRDPQPIIYSICIPRVFSNISEKRVRAIMYSLKFGFVERVDMVSKKNQKGEEFSRVFVHFSSWNDQHDPAMQVRAKLDAGDKVKIVYDNPWYWMISKSGASLPEQRKTRTNRPAPFIDFGHTPPAASHDTPQSPPPFLPTQREPRPMPVMPQSPDYAPTSPDYAPPSPDYLPHTPTDPLPKREMTMTVGHPEYVETEEERTERLQFEEEQREAEYEFRRKKEMNALGI